MPTAKRSPVSPAEQYANARDALIAEVIGDVSTLLDKLAAMLPELERAHEEVQLARQQLSEEVKGFRVGIVLGLKKVHNAATSDLVRAANVAAKDSFDLQRSAMNDVATALFKSELDTALRKLVVPLNELVAHLNRPWERWATHVATALTASGMTFALCINPWGG